VFATVLAIGQGKRQDDGSFLPMQLGVGNRIVVRRFTGSVVKHPHTGELLEIIPVEEIMARLEG